MNFDAFSGNSRSRRQTSLGHASAMIESLEARALLSAEGPSILSPTGTIANPAPTVTWETINGAVSYDLWISDMETRERIVFKEGIVGTSTTLNVAERLNLGVNRIWVRATLPNNVKTAWGTPTDVLLKARPVVTGPTTIDGSDWAITWNSPAGAQSFEVFVSNQTTLTSATYTVNNQTPALNADGKINTGLVENPSIDITSANHGLVTGDRVRITEVLGNNAANGDFTVTVLSANAFRLEGVLGTGDYSSGGKWVRLIGTDPASAATARGITGVANYRTGYSIEQEVRSLYLSGAVPIVGATPQAVSNVVNKSWIDVTSANHGLRTGDKVRVSGVLGNTAANGDFLVTALSENVFRLNGASSNSNYTSGGKWIRLSGNFPAAGATWRVISNVMNSRAVEVTVFNHGLKTGEQVRITGVEGDTEANGTFYVAVLSSNVIQLRGVAGQSAYVKGGQLTQLTKFQSDLPMGQYRVFIRSKDDAGRISAWSAAYDFDVAPAVNTRRPQGPTFEEQPLLEWDAVPGATHYQVEVYRTGEVVPLYKADYLTTTSYRIPEKLTSDPVQNFEYRVRARKLHEVALISLTGTPASGSYRLQLTTTGNTPRKVQTGLINFNATADDVKGAVALLEGFENVEVVTQGTTPNLTYLLQIPLYGNALDPQVLGGGAVKVAIVNNTLTPGSISVTTRLTPRVDGQWSDTVAFSTLQTPVITGPLGIETSDPDAPITVTDLRPTVQWTAVDKAARYEIWVERSASTSTFLKKSVSTNSYQFEANLPSGNYTVKVRAISTTGKYTDWSSEYAFTATGGVPVIQSVVISGTRRATIVWAPVAEAVTYELQIAWIGVNFDYLHPEGVTGTSYTTPASLTPGNYRVWVRAVTANGTKLGWSSYQNFTVVLSEEPQTDQPDATGLVALASVLPADGELPEFIAPDTTAQEHVTAVSMAETQEMNEQTEAPIQSSHGPGMAQFTAAPVLAARVTGSADEELIQQLAEACARQEWWTGSENLPA